MKTHKTKNKGSALLLVVVVTMLLSVIGIVFIMTARLRGIAASGVTDSRDLDAAVQSVVSRVDTVLVQDLFGMSLNKTIIDGTSGNEPYDDLTKDTWLASLEPSIGIDGFGQSVFYWQQVTDLCDNNFGVPGGYFDPQTEPTPPKSEWDGTTNPELEVDATGVLTKIITPGERVHVIKKNAADWSAANLWYAGARADADGDGVADSRWMIVPNLTTGGGKPVYAAVRIIDNCAMLNLNAAYCFYQDHLDNVTSPFLKLWYLSYDAKTATSIPYAQDNGTHYMDGGRYLSEINYLPFLRGSDNFGSDGDSWYRILSAKGFCQPGGTYYDPSSLVSTGQTHQILMNIENPGSSYSLFNTSEELEIRNRFLLTSKVESRFERKDVGNYTLDAGGGVYAVLETPVDDSTAFDAWKIKMNPANFDLWDETGALRPDPTPPTPDNRFKYDRRHLCTFYSFDRNIRTGKYPMLDAALQTIPAIPAAQRQAAEEIFRPLNYHPIDLRSITDTSNLDRITANALGARKNILHLLYAFREYFWDNILAKGTFGYPPSQARALAARQAAQFVANMIDYTDNDTTAATGPFADSAYGAQINANPTYITKAIIDAMITENDPAVTGNTAFDFGLTGSDIVYGYERQPFISEVYTRYVAAGSGAVAFALELINPYPTALNLQGWKIQIGTQNCPLDSSYASIPPGRLVIYNTGMAPPTSGTVKPYPSFGLGTPMQLPGNVLRLQRPDPANVGQFLTVDRITDSATDGITNGQREHLVTDGIRVTKRQNTNWGFANLRAYVNDTTQTLGIDNNVTVAGGYALPVANDSLPIARLADFQKIIYTGNEGIGTDPNTITKLVADAFSGDGESKLRFDPVNFPPLSRYVCTLSREEKGIPGRININTAPKYVIAAAIPPNLVMSSTTDPNVLYLAGQIVANRPYTSLADLLTKVPAITKFANNNPAIVGDTSISGDFEKRDWIVNRLSNIFTVRSDTFTAYILVRLGVDGPQRRMMAIFDRSNCWSATDKPKLVALHPVPDPR